MTQRREHRMPTFRTGRSGSLSFETRSMPFHLQIHQVPGLKVGSTHTIPVTFPPQYCTHGQVPVTGKEGRKTLFPLWPHPQECAGVVLSSTLIWLLFHPLLIPGALWQNVVGAPAITFCLGQERQASRTFSWSQPQHIPAYSLMVEKNLACTLSPCVLSWGT